MSQTADRIRTSPRHLLTTPLTTPTTFTTTTPPSARAADVPAVTWRDRYRRRVWTTDVLVVIAACALAGTISHQNFIEPTRPAAAVAVVVGLLWLAMLHVFHTRSPRGMALGATEYKRVIDSTAATAGIYAVLALLIDGTGGRYFLLIGFPAGLAGLLAGRWAWRTWLHHSRVRGCALSDVVVVGAPEEVEYVLRQIDRKSGAAYRAVGVVLTELDENLPEVVTSAASPVSGVASLPQYSGMTQILTAVSDLAADAVIVAGPLPGGNRAIRDLGWALEETQAEIILVSSLTNVSGPRISVRPVEGLPLMHVEQPTFTGARHAVKRAMDVTVSAATLLLLLPLFAVLAVLIRRDSPGPVIFRQTRTGRHGVPFTMYKFRTMGVDAEQQKAALAASNDGAGPLFKLKDDPRVTKIGAFLRRHSLDELPQFYNVLRGDMSLVGPRPPLSEEVASYAGHEGRRLYIKPGLTGLWQISGRSNLSWDESVRLDLYYVENWSVTGDLQIMWRTFKVMLHPEGAY